jgi:triacylglycerol lipase
MVKNYLATGEFPLLNTLPEDYDKRWPYLFARQKFIPYAVTYSLGLTQANDYALHRQILNTLQASEPIEQRYANLQVPTLIVSGAQDRVIPPESVHTLARVFVNGRIKIMSDTGHIPMVEAPKQTADDYLAFRKSLKQAE